VAQDFKRDVKWNTIHTFSVNLAGILTGIIIKRTLGLEAMGTYTYALSLAAIFQLVANFGGSTYQITDHKAEFLPQNYLFSKILTSSVAGILTVSYLSVLWATGTSFEIILLSAILTMYLTVQTLSVPLYAIFQRHDRLYLSGQIGSTKDATTVLFIAIICYTVHSLNWSALSMLIVSIGFFIFIEYPQALKYEKLQLLHLNFRREISDALQTIPKHFILFIIQLISGLMAYIPRFFLETYTNNIELQGYFGLLFIPLGIIGSVAGLVIHPLIVPLTRNIGNQRYSETNRTNLKIIAVTLVSTIILLPCAYVLAKPLYQLIYVIDMSPYFTEIMLMIPYALIVIAGSVFTTTLTILRKLKTVMIISIINLISILAFSAWLIQPYEVHGAIASVILAGVLSQLIAVGVYIFQIRKLLAQQREVLSQVS
jgi:O-antigen/teichoic acid export membrane protein